MKKAFKDTGYYDEEKLKTDVRSIKVYENKLVIVPNMSGEREVIIL